MTAWESFGTVDIEVSGVVPAPPHAVWTHLSSFGDLGEYMTPVNGHVVRTTLMGGNCERQIGARRLLQVGPGRLVEELTALDHDNQTLSFKTVSDNLNVNPFPASFVNHKCTIKQRAVTTTGQTFVEICGRFMTEHGMMDVMEETWECLYESIIYGLTDRLAGSYAPVQYGMSGYRGPGGNPGPLGTCYGASKQDASEFLKTPSAQYGARHSCDLKPMDSDSLLPPRSASSFDLHPKQYAGSAPIAKAPQTPQPFLRAPSQVPSSHSPAAAAKPSTAPHRSRPTSHHARTPAPAGAMGGTPEAHHVHHAYPAAALAMDSALFRSTASAGRQEMHPGVQTPPQVVEHSRSGSRSGAARYPQGVAESLAAIHHLQQQQQQQGLGGFGVPSAGPKLVPMRAELVSPFACASINRAASTMSCGMATPEEGHSRRVSFD